jgi:UDP-N-acetylglucosamine 2-epimerase (non-hydrolysing)
VENLRREGVDEKKIHLVGNVMIDTLLAHRERARRSGILEALGLEPSHYGVLTLHRPSNVDDPAVLRRILEPVRELSRRIPVVFPVHPRTHQRLGALGEPPERGTDVKLTEPLGYLDFLHLMDRARIVLTDSGGIQEETTILRIPCVTIRENTERPITLTHGTNRLAGTTSEGIRRAIAEALADHRRPRLPPPLWDGRAAVRIADVIERWANG